MKFGLDVATDGEYADPHKLVDLAMTAEQAGWDGFFVWDVLFAHEAPEEPIADPIRAEKLDEGLAILKGLWTEDHLGFQGTHYQLNDVTLRPRPVQSPHIPADSQWPTKIGGSGTWLLGATKFLKSLSY